MKKSLCMLLLIALLCLTACQSSTPEKGANNNDITTDANLTKSVELPLPQETADFSFLSGAGAWRTAITLHRDGTFTGYYLDSEMGDAGDGYPNGSAYICSFSGKFENIEKMDEYSYKMTLGQVTTENPIGEEWIEEGIRYVATEPHGLYDPEKGQNATEFIFYLPDAPIDQLSEEFLTWWPYRYDQDENAKTFPAMAF